MNPRVLVVEDDGPLRDLLGRGLREEGFAVVTVPDAAGAMRLASADCAAMILDVMLPDADGRDLCAALRAQGVIAPALFLTARGSVEDRLSGFAAGADDYLTKPFHFAELVARLQVLIRRAPAGTTAQAAVTLDPVSHAVQTPGGSVRLTPTEFRLLSVLAAAPGAVVRRRELVRAGWPNGAIVHENTLDQYVARLRRKLRGVHAPVAVETAHGVGYRYVVAES